MERRGSGPSSSRPQPNQTLNAHACQLAITVASVSEPSSLITSASAAPTASTSSPIRPRQSACEPGSVCVGTWIEDEAGNAVVETKEDRRQRVVKECATEPVARDGGEVVPTSEPPGEVGDEASSRRDRDIDAFADELKQRGEELLKGHVGRHLSGWWLNNRTAMGR